MSSGAMRAVAGLCAMTVAASALCGCGYGPARGPQRAFCVLPGASRRADAIAESALASGVREGLASAGALGSCSTSRRVRVEIVRISATPVGALQQEGGAAARGQQIAVVGRATVELEERPWSTESEGEATVEVSRSVASAAQTESDARARAARQAGLGLAARLAGLADPGRAEPSLR